MKDSDFTFDYVNLLYCNCHKINMKSVGSYVDSPVWIKNKKATLNPVNNYDKCFQYAATAALNHEELAKKFATNVKN